MIFFIIAFIVILIDQLTKLVIIFYANSHSIPIGKGLTNWQGILNFVYSTNPGAAFGIFPDQRLLFVAISIIAILAILIYVWRYKKQISGWTNTGFALIFGGAVGNLIDRVFRVEVVDFIDFHIGRYHWPAFNLADTAICVGVGLIIIELFLKTNKGKLV